MLQPSLQELQQLFSPWVMRSAWNKVQYWYRGGELYDIGEYLAWQADPWAHLSTLATDLASGKYHPDPFPVVPFPKKGNRLRHYTIPTVRDQVAFTAFLVLLGPFFEARMPNVSFGNRLYRPRVLHQGRWHRAPFSLNQSAVYDSFPSGYGLFRRLLQWLSNSAVLGDAASEQAAKAELQLDDPDLLPYLHHPWPRGISLAHARLDLSLAYPSVNRDRLAKQMVRLMRKDGFGQIEEDTLADADLTPGTKWGRPSFPSLDLPPNRPFDNWLEKRKLGADGQPWRRLTRNQSLRVALAKYLGKLVQEIHYAPWAEPPGWEHEEHYNPQKHLPQGYRSDPVGIHKPEQYERYDTRGLWPADCHLDEQYLKEQQFGLPTGLAISGLLLNVALTSVDEHMVDEYEAAPVDQRVFYLRFVDDIVLLAPNEQQLETAVLGLREQLKGSSPQFFLNPAKAEPDSVQTYLRQLNNPKFPKTPSLRLKSSEYLTRANVETFTTSVVREMSGLADEALEESFGASGVDRLNQLLDLAARNDEDSEVGTDARLSFAVNKAARAAWPKDAVLQDGQVIEPEAYVRRILLTAEKALRNHPWRLKLWKALLIIGLRAGELGETWLDEQVLPLMRWDGPAANHSARSWEQGDDPSDFTEDDEEKRPADGVWQRRRRNLRLYASFHRAWFWREWAACVRALRRIVHQGETTADPGSWLSHFPRHKARAALRWFDNPQRWAGVLYGDAHKGYWPGGMPFMWWWEAEQLRDAMLASLTPAAERLEFLGNPRSGTLRRGNFPLPGSEYVFATDEKRVLQLRRALQRVYGYGQEEPATNPDFPQKLAVLWVLRGNTRPKALQELFKDKAMRGLVPTQGRDALEWAAIARLDLWEQWEALRDLSVGWAAPMSSPQTLWEKLILLDAYAQLRRILLAHGQVVTWKLFAAWFPQLRMKNAGLLPGARLPHGARQRSLLEAMYRLAGATAPADGLVPALELSGPAAFALADGARAVSEDQGGFVAPDTVLLEPTAFSLLTRSRRALVEAGSGQPDAESVDYAVELLITLLKRSQGLVKAVQPLLPDHRAPHPLFLFPELVFQGLPTDPNPHRWRTSLLLLWLLAGGERVLDQVYPQAPWHLPLSDRDDLRSGFVLPEPVWQYIEEPLGSTLARTRYRQAEDELDLSNPWEDIAPDKAEEAAKVRDIGFHDGEWFVLPPGALAEREQVGSQQDLRVRLVQALAEPQPSLVSWARLMSYRRPLLERPTYEAIATELADRLREARDQARLRQGATDDLVIFPEWFTPPPYVPKLKQFVRETGVAVLSGVLIRELPRVVPVISSVKSRGWRLLTNEAALILPNYQPGRGEKPAAVMLPSRVYEFRVRKPYPAANELGLVRRLQDLTDARGEQSRWAFVCGTQWYRWTYPNWGSFSVAICSDILDTFIWDWLRGRIQHLFVTAWNRDIDLFDQISWTRGYELYANVATVNHGSNGGSVVWTPKSNHSKELFRVHGPNKGLAVQVDLPVAGLIEAQDTALNNAIERARMDWRPKKPDPKKPPRKKLEFKTPAPNYRRRRKP